jgi:hypothetical protein
MNMFFKEKEAMTDDYTCIHKQAAATGRNMSRTTMLTCDMTTRTPMSCMEAIIIPLKLYCTSVSSLL